MQHDWMTKIAGVLFRKSRPTMHELMGVALLALSLSVLSLCLSVAGARGDEITIGYWDASQGDGVTPIAHSSGAEIIYLYQDGSPSNIGPVFGGNLTALTFTQNGSTWREAAFDNVFAGTNDTIRIYFSFQGVTTPTTQIIFPTIFQVSEAQPGFVVAEQIYTCRGPLFCDDYIVGGGTGVGAAYFASGQSGTSFLTLAGSAGSPYNITEVFTIATTGAGGDVAGAILTQPDPHHHAVPGPIVGAGLPGLMAACATLLALARRRRRAL